MGHEVCRDHVKKYCNVQYCVSVLFFICDLDYFCS